MLSQQQIEAYHRDGYVFVEGAIKPEMLARIDAIVASYIEKARFITESNEIYDLETSHTPQQPRVRRLNAPVNRDPLFWDLIRDPAVIGPVMQVLGPNLRLYGSKLNMKSAGYGASVEWHQDWAYYPHTNDSVCAVGIMLDDVTDQNGPLQVIPGSHKGPIIDHTSDGYFIGGIEAADAKVDLSKAVRITGRAGGFSIHHVRMVHGSALNLSNRPRRMLFYEIAAADAWPLWTDNTGAKYKNFDHMFYDQMIVGEPSLQPRMEAVPVRVPGPVRDTIKSLYQLQTESKRRYFGTVEQPGAQRAT